MIYKGHSRLYTRDRTIFASSLEMCRNRKVSMGMFMVNRQADGS